MTDAITNVDLTVAPNDDTVYAVVSWLKANGHCVAVFSPLEIRGADTELMQSMMIEAGIDAMYGDSDFRIIPTT